MQAWIPPTLMKGSEWADKYYVISETGRKGTAWRCFPPQRAILDAITDPNTERVTVRKSTRVGYTKILNIVVGIFAHMDPSDILIVQPTLEDALEYSKEEIAPMFEDVPVLRGLLKKSRAKDSGNTILHKSLKGMILSLVGANSPTGFRRKNRKVVLFDELNGYPSSAGPEGDPEKLGERRADFYWDRKIIKGSTPTVKGRSRITRNFEAGDQRYYHAPCPFCGTMQKIIWDQFDYTDQGTPDNPVYVCVKCGKGIDYSYHHWMMDRGEWIAEKEFKGHASFHYWSACSYSPGAHWSIIVREYLEAKKALDEFNDPEPMKTWTNTFKGEDYEDESKTINVNALFDRRESYPCTMPHNSAVLIGTVDTQDDRLELLVTAWGLKEECWILDHAIFWGSPKQKDVWMQLDSALGKKYDHESGAKIGFSAVGIDSGGHATTEVYDFVKPREGRGVYALKGSSTNGAPVIARPGTGKTNKGNVKLFHVGTVAAKDTISARLDISEDGPCKIHIRDTLDYEFIEQIGNEIPINYYHHGVPMHRWELKRKGLRVEGWDLLVYAFAVMRLVCKDSPTLDRMVQALHQRYADQKAGVAVKSTTSRRRIISGGLE